MRGVLSFLGGLIGLISLVALNIGLSYILPYPFSKINLIFAILIIITIWRGTGQVVWFAFFAHFVVELFAASPFGVILFSSTISILLGYWLFKNFFTNRSWYAAIALSGIFILFYRLLYVFSLLLAKIFNENLYIPWRLIFSTFLWEELFTIILVALLYFILSRFFKQLKGTVIEAKHFSI